jgi:hypothetical protein
MASESPWATSEVKNHYNLSMRYFQYSLESILSSSSAIAPLSHMCTSHLGWSAWKLLECQPLWCHAIPWHWSYKKVSLIWQWLLVRRSPLSQGAHIACIHLHTLALDLTTASASASGTAVHSFSPPPKRECLHPWAPLSIGRVVAHFFYYGIVPCLA